MRTVTLHSALPEPAADGAAPAAVHLVPAGSFKGQDGRGPYTLRSAQAVIAASMAAGRLPIDENHATDHGMKTGQPAPARGWIVGMEARADGIWGQVEWTPSGKALMADRAYRGISPVIAHRQDGEILQVLRAGLTNAPNLPQLASLNSQQEPDVDLTKLRAALGLADTADEAAILAAAETARTAVATHAQQLQRLAEAAKLPKPGEATADAIITALQTQSGGEAQLRTELVSLQTQLNTLRADAAKEKATAVVDAAIRDGKPIPAALRDHYIARHAQNPADVEKELAALPNINAGGLGGRTPPAGPAEVDPRGIANEAIALQSKQREAGIELTTAEAVAEVMRQKRSAQ